MSVELESSVLWNEGTTVWITLAFVFSPLIALLHYASLPDAEVEW
jgi:hypothetical protein